MSVLAEGMPLMSTQHTILSSLSTWQETVEYSSDPTIRDAMKTGHPRFLIHRIVQKLADICQEKFGFDGERCLLLPTQRTAEDGKKFIHALALRFGKPSEVRVVHFCIGSHGDVASSPETDQPVEHGSDSPASAEVYIIFFRAATNNVARQFWQNCGLGISSRYAEHCLSLLGAPGFPSESLHTCGNPLPGVNGSASDSQGLSTGSDAKVALRQRIASLFVRDESPIAPSNISEEDVFLFPSGMAAMWNAHQLLMAARPLEKSVIFGFSYLDTLKIVERSGPGAVFYGHGRQSDIDNLDNMLARRQAENPSSPPILALYTECPSNPRLHTVDMPRLRALADQYNFVIVIDETVGTFANVDVLPYADIIITSLSKFVSGHANVLGGSLVINPRMRYYSQLKSHLESRYEDTYFDSDAIVMERNSRNFLQRMRIANSNAEYICDFLRARSLEGRAPSEGIRGHIIKQVYYPKFVSRDNYEICRRRSPTGEPGTEHGGYGALFSLTFTSMRASEAFFDALKVTKGPGVGMMFTSSCPYTILCHSLQLEWAAQYGVDATLVRVSVGVEDREVLRKALEMALKAAEI